MNSRQGLLAKLNPETDAAKQIQSMKVLAAHGLAESESIDLSDDQEKALAKIDSWLTESREPCFSLIGPAGSGKTTIMRQAIDLARKKRWVVNLSAPTHQAAARLKDATGRHAETVHRVMGCRMIKDKKTGKEGIKAGKPSISPDSFLIIDESSMLGERLLSIVTNFADKNSCKVLFVGDKAQLNPVREWPSLTVDPERCTWGFAELETIHRQAAENPIIAAATRVRLAEPSELIRFETKINDNQGIEVYSDKKAWADQMIQGCASDNEENRYIAYTNRATDEAAKAVRRHVFGDEAAKPYLPGELLVVNSRVVLDDGGKKKSKKKQRFIQSNDQVRVLSCHRSGDIYHVECDWHDEIVTLQAFENYSLRDECLRKLGVSARDRSDWTAFFKAEETIADLRSAVSITAHSSQGSTFDDVFMNLDQISRCYNREERQRLLYVALTRASRKVHLVGELR